MSGLIRGLARLETDDWVMMLRAAVGLFRARIAYGRTPVHTLIGDLQARGATRPAAATPDDRVAARIERLRWALAALGRRMPFRADCVVQVLAAERIVLGWGLAPQFFLGVERPGDNGFAAHVWLKVGDQVVTGGAVDGYTVMIGKNG